MEYKKQIDKIIHNKVCKPINIGLKYYINKFNIERKSKHDETIYLLEQSYISICDSEELLKEGRIVDSNILLRSAFEFLMMGINIQFNEKVYNEFINLTLSNKEREETKPTYLPDEFRKHLNDICSDLFKPINRNDKKEMLNELYNNLCLYTHSTLFVSTNPRIKKEKVRKVYIIIGYLNIYFLKLLLYLSLKYFVGDNKYYIELNDLYFSHFFKTFELLETINNCKEDLEDLKNYYYLDKNQKYLEESLKKTNNIKESLNEMKEEINSEEFINNLKQFLNIKE